VSLDGLAGGGRGLGTGVVNGVGEGTLDTFGDELLGGL